MQLLIYYNKKQKTDAELAKNLLPKIRAFLETVDDFSSDNLFNVLSSFAESLEVKARQLFYVLRIAVTGLEVTPGGATEILEIIKKEETLSRLDFAISLL